MYAVKHNRDYIFFFLPQLYLFLTFYSCQKPHPSCPCVKNDRKVKLFIGPTDFEVCLRMADCFIALADLCTKMQQLLMQLDDDICSVFYSYFTLKCE